MRNIKNMKKGVYVGLLFTLIQLILNIIIVFAIHKPITNYIIISLIATIIIIAISILGLKNFKTIKTQRNLYIIAGILSILHMSILTVIGAIGFLYSAYILQKELAEEEYNELIDYKYKETDEDKEEYNEEKKDR